jgi:hypothetical protein
MGLPHAGLAPKALSSTANPGALLGQYSNNVQIRMVVATACVEAVAPWRRYTGPHLM